MSATAPQKELREIGDYDLLARIAEGGMGSVYKGRHKKTGQIVAIKIVPPTLAKNDVVLKRFRQEFRVASGIEHPNVVRALDFGQEGESWFLAMEFVDGESLGERIERIGQVPEYEAVNIIIQAAKGVGQAHQSGLVHRDIKPDNILIRKGDGVAKIADLGLAKDAGADMNLTRTGRGLGTPHFMSPEQFRDAKRVGPRGDIYALGATLYMAVTGQLPFRAATPLDAWTKKVKNDILPPRHYVPNLNERVDWAIRRAMNPDPERRPATCQEFIDDLTGAGQTEMLADPTLGNGQELYYVHYRDSSGESKIVKGSTEALRKALQDGHLGNADEVRAALTKTGQFLPLTNFPEFQDLFDEATVTPVKPIVVTKPVQTVAPANLPQINFQPPNPPEESSGIWVWIMVFLLAVGSGVVAFYFMNQ